MIKFHRGMRRVAFFILAAGCVLIFGSNLKGGAANFWNATGETLAWVAGFCVFAFIVRWIWLGFFEERP